MHVHAGLKGVAEAPELLNLGICLVECKHACCGYMSCISYLKLLNNHETRVSQVLLSVRADLLKNTGPLTSVSSVFGRQGS